MKVRPFVLLSQRDMQALEVKLGGVVEQWRRHTLPPRFVTRMGSVSTALDYSQAQAVSKLHIQRVATQQGGQCVLGTTPGMFQTFCLMLIDREQAVATNLITPKTILFGAAEAVLTDLAVRLLGGCHDDQYVVEKDAGSLLEESKASGSGCIHFNVDLEQVRFNIALTHAAVSTLLIKRSHYTGPCINLSPRKDAIGRITTRLQAELGDIELSLGVLTSLQVGDVIRTEHCVRDPMIVRFQGTATELTGFLGARDGKRAINVTGVRNTFV